MQLTCTLSNPEVTTDTVPCSRLRNAFEFYDELGLNQDGSFGVEMGGESRFGLHRVAREDGVEPDISVPFSQTPSPPLGNIAGPLSAPTCGSGSKRTMMQKMKLRNPDRLIPKLV
jgi:hypothetical protein